MPKLKTHKGASKRFKKTGTGKIKRHHAFARHILTSKSRSRKRKLGQGVIARRSQQSGNPPDASVLTEVRNARQQYWLRLGGQCAARA